MLAEQMSVRQEYLARGLMTATTPAEQVGAVAGYAIGLLAELNARTETAEAAARIVQATTDICADLIAGHERGARSPSTASTRPTTSHPSTLSIARTDTHMIAQPTGVRMSEKYRIRLIKRDGSKTWPETVNLDPEMKPAELQSQLIGAMRRHTYEDWPERNAKHYSLEVLKNNTDDVVIVHRGN